MGNEVEVKEKKDITDKVLERVNLFKSSGEIKIPSDYSPENALKSAWLILQETKDREGKASLEVCTKESIANCLFNMVTQGLSPVKKQCYFVVYGKTLTLMRSYMGSIALAKRYGNVSDVAANVIYDKDDFEFETDISTGNKKILRHKQTLESLDGEIIGAYALVTSNDGGKYLEIMTIQQIKAAWNQGQTKGASPAHKNFMGEMAKKSVINRACKLFINTSSDAVLMDEDDEFEASNSIPNRAKYEIADNANKGNEISMDNPVELTIIDAHKPTVTNHEDVSQEEHEQVSLDPGF